MIKSCEYVCVGENQVYVPPPSSVLGGMARDRWLRRVFDAKTNITIAGESQWRMLREKYGVQIVTDEDR